MNDRSPARCVTRWARLSRLCPACLSHLSDCLTCLQAFKHKSHLKDHERRHRGEKPFVCRSCTKAFAKVTAVFRGWDQRLC